MKCLLLLLLLETVTESRTSIIKRLAVILAGVGAGIIMLYFSYFGRLLNRISLSVLMGVFLVKGTLTEGRDYSGKDRPLHIVAFTLLAIFSLLSCVKTVSTVEYLPNASFMSAKSGENEEDYDNDDVLYIWNASLTSMDSTKIGKLPSKEHLKHNIMIGGWEYGQNYHKELSNQRVDPKKSGYYAWK